MKDNALYRLTKVLSKLAEVACWIGSVSMAVGLILTLVMGEKAVAMAPGDVEISLNSFGFEVLVVDAAGSLNLAALRLYLAAGMVLMGLMAMVFRNVNLILRASEGATPFQPDNIRMVREIGIFLIAAPVAGLVFSVVGRLMLGAAYAEINVNLGGLLPGLVVLCLSQIFARGMELEQDVDGLL